MIAVISHKLSNTQTTNPHFFGCCLTGVGNLLRTVMIQAKRKCLSNAKYAMCDLFYSNPKIYEL